MSTEILPLESDECLNPNRVGAKAARLAFALRRGFPVPTGKVIPNEVSDDVLLAAAREVGSVGVHSARLSIMTGTAPDLRDLVDGLSALGDDLIVRSSAALEDSPDYAGAFTSYLGVTLAESPTAVRGVWASALCSYDVAGPKQSVTASGTPPHMAVLIQRQLHPSFSGTGQIGDDGIVHVVVVAGPPAPLLSGWVRGEMAAISASGDVTGPAGAVAGEQLLRAIANMARRVHSELNDDLIEWAAVGEDPVLLQSKRGARRRIAPADNSSVDPQLPAAAGVARMLHAFAGRLGEDLVLPVVLAGISHGSGIPAPQPRHPVTHQMATTAWTNAQALSHTLRTEAWGEDTAAARRRLSQLRGGAMTEVIGYLMGLRRAGAAEVADLFQQLGTVAQWLVDTSMLYDSEDLWSVPPSEVVGMISGRSKTAAVARREHRRLALLRWEPVVYAAIQGTGSAVFGEAAGGGVGAGPAVIVHGVPTDAPRVARMVVVASHPIPQLAPLMWGAAGLVTAFGGTSAHLIEVARSRGVPAVVGCDEDLLFSFLRQDVANPPLVAVDGDRGRVTMDVSSD